MTTFESSHTDSLGPPRTADQTAKLDPAEVLAHLPGKVRALHEEIQKCVVGQQAAVDAALYALLSRGHCLIEGVPGLGKTLLVRAMACVMKLVFRRVQFTPDLMPADIT
ncbi:MAG: AAA family ATPase, partial [Planctomycetota bacterium]